jgi:ADP-heptose:LPS heptosyltransferase
MHEPEHSLSTAPSTLDGGPGKGMRKILIIRFSSIGDIVLTTPVIRCLKTQLPNAEIHYLTKKSYHSLLASNPYLTKTWLFHDNFDHLIPQLVSEKFDFIVDLHHNLRSRFVKLKLRRPSDSFPKLNLRKWILVNLGKDILPRVHIVDRYFEAVQKLSVTNDGMGLDYFIPPGEELDAALVFPTSNQGFVAFSIGGKHNTKILPEEKVIEICTKTNRPVLLMGGPEDRDRGHRIVQATGTHVVNGCGSYSINQSASLIRQSSQVITNDTGLMHIAAAFKKPILSIWGNTVPAFGMYPYLPDGSNVLSEQFEVKGLSCRPCSKIGYEKCPKGHFRCMMEQESDKIAAHLI